MGVSLLIVSLVATIQRWRDFLRLIAKSDELGALGCFVAVDHGDSVGNDTHPMSCPRC